MRKAAKHRIIFLVFITLIIAIFIIITFTRTKNNNNSSWIHPMKVYGAITCAETGTGVTFVILTSDDISLAPKVTTAGGIEVTSVPALTFPEITDDLLTVSNIHCTNAIETAGGICWMLEADLTPNHSCTEESVEITRICYGYDDTEYEIGRLQLLLNQNYETASDILSLSSNIAGSIGRGLQPYHAEFLNTGSSAIDHYDITYPMYNDAENSYTMDGSTEISSISPGSKLFVESDFSHCDLDEYDFYYVTPILTYEYEGKEYTSCLPLYNSGFQLSEEDVRYYIELYGKTEP